MTTLQGLLVGLYFVPVTGLLLFAGNLYYLVVLFLRSRRSYREGVDRLRTEAVERLNEADLPSVVTQIPVYNELNVVERVLIAAADMEYPADRHEIQVLDDSTDATAEVIDRVAANLRARGHRIEVLRRSDRDGYKAGALREGMLRSDAPFIALFDADFVPPRDFLRRTVEILLLQPGVGFVQARWGHLNPRENLLTRLQVVALDGHFAVEQPARAWNGCFINFNGTAGLWRRQAIDDAGGWEGDTLTEDMDLSYRAQLQGWQPFYLTDLAVPAELPSDMYAFKAQQFRWAKGSIQTARKLLPAVLRSPATLRAKVQAVFHMTHYLTHPLLLLMILLALPVLLFTPFRDEPVLVWLFVSIVAAGTLAPTTLYAVSQRALHPPDRRASPRLIPLLMLVGIGMTLSNSCAVFEALLGRRSEFVRTPKRGEGGHRRYLCAGTTAGGAELAIAAYAYGTALVYLFAAKTLVVPFLFLYATGFLTVGLMTLRDGIEARAHELNAEDESEAPVPCLVEGASNP